MQKGNEVAKKTAQNSLIVETKYAATLNLLLEKEKEDFMQSADQT